MTEQQEVRTRGTGPKVDVHKPAKRLKAAYRRAHFYPNPRFNAEQPPGAYNPRMVKSEEAPTLREFAAQQNDDDSTTWFSNKRTLARQTIASYRLRNKLPPKAKNIKSVKSAKSGGDKSGKKGKSGG